MRFRYCALLVWIAVSVAQAQKVAPLPDPRALLAEVREHQKQLQKVRENYTFLADATSEEVDAKGRVTHTESFETENFFVNGHHVSRKVKQDGKPLAGKDLEKETERVTKRVEKASQTPADQSLDSNAVNVQHMLEWMEVRNPARISYRGRATIRFDFVGRKDVKARGMEQDLSKKLEGSIWVDEADRQVAHMEVRLTDNFHIAGGLVANIQKGSSFAFDQALVGEGLWLPTGAEAAFDVKLFLVKGMRQRYHERDSEFKRFHTEVEQGTDVKVLGVKPGPDAK